MERTAGIAECPAGGYHIQSDYGFLEFRDIRPLPEGETSLAKVVGTSLYNMAMPLIRYDIGDDIEIYNEPRSCSCGRTFPLVKAIHGRSEDTIITPEGRYVTSIFIIPEFVRGIRFIQFVQEQINQLAVRVVPTAHWDETEHEKLNNYTQRLVGTSMSIRTDVISEKDLITDQSGKRRAVISRIK
jgi:phenylacetate-CoA ligase